jgi:hypothetical protein
VGAEGVVLEAPAIEPGLLLLAVMLGRASAFALEREMHALVLAILVR